MRRNVNKEVSETSNHFGICYVHGARGIICSISCCPMKPISVNVHSPSPSGHDCSHFTSGDSDTGCDRRLRPRGSHTCHSVGVLSGTPTDFSYFEVNRIEMAVRTEHERNRNQLTMGPQLRWSGSWPKRMPTYLTLHTLYNLTYPVFAFRKLIVWLH